MFWKGNICLILLKRRLPNILRRKYTTDSINIKDSWESVIGLEIHAQISSKSKLFSRAESRFAGYVNNQVGYFDAALPGTLPVINKKCVEAAAMTALALNCNINLVSSFDRKHYFYADLPAGYQITQQRQPIATNGLLKYTAQVINTYTQHQAQITQLQLEQDSGKSLHNVEDTNSLIDLNRAGIALMEIVTAPDFKNGEEAAAFVKELKAILETIGTCDGKMQEGSLRVDASISLRKPGEPLGTRAEVKNIGSIRCIANAVEYEIKRQKKILESGGEVANETRYYDYENRKTISMRDKEKLHDYRFLPEPNLPPLRVYTNETLPKGADPLSVVNVDDLKKKIPELPGQKVDRFVEDYTLSIEHAVRIVREPGLPDYFESVMKKTNSKNIRVVTAILLNQVLGFLNEDNITYVQCPIKPEQIVEVVDLLEQKVIASTTKMQVLKILYMKAEHSVLEAVKKNNLGQITDDQEIEGFCKCAIRENPKTVSKYKKGKAKATKTLIETVLIMSNWRIEREVISQTLNQLLELPPTINSK